MSSSPSRSPFPDDAPPWGAVVAGKYRVTRTLGRGGMGVVLAAEHVELRQEVALKFLHREMALHPTLVRRFLREGQAAARLRSEHVARVLDVARTDDGQPFLVMELLDGIDLGQKLRRDGPLPIADAVLYVLQTCAAIGEAHALGIVHRDLKPANLFLARRPDGSPLVKVVDFGISKIADAPDAVGEVTLTTGADVLGSPLYMAPEQIRTPHDVDGRADLWSLGAILHRLVSNEHAFPATTPAAVLAAIVADPPVPLRRHAPHAPAELENIVARCLTRDLSLRWQSASELADALRPFAAGGGQAGQVVVPGPRATAPLAGPTVAGPTVAGPPLAGPPLAGPPLVGPPVAEVTMGGGSVGGGSVSSLAFAPDRRRLVSSVVIATAIALVAVGFFAMVQMGGGDDQAAAVEPRPALAAGTAPATGAPSAPAAPAATASSGGPGPDAEPRARATASAAASVAPSASAATPSSAAPPPPRVAPAAGTRPGAAAPDPLDGRL
jgi:serine/threonine-protein kinase